MVPALDVREATRALDTVERRLARFDRGIGLADWAMYTGRGDERVLVRWQTERAEFLRDPAQPRLVERLAETAASATVARRTELLRRSVLDAAVEQAPEIVRLRSRLQARIVRYRPLWKGKRVGRAEVYNALRCSTDRRERERAWRAHEPLHRSLEAPLRRLIGLRNDRARAVGFRSFAELRLSYEGVPPRRLRALAHDAARPLRRLARELRIETAERTGEAGWAPWDLRFAGESRAPLPKEPFPGDLMVETVQRALRQWGIPPARLDVRIVRCDLPFGGLTVAPEIPDDVRILVHPSGGWEYYMVLFHEYGHAVHFRSVDQPTHLLRNPDLGFAGFAEGLAGVFEQVASDAAWLGTVRGLDPHAVEEFCRRQSEDAVFAAASTALGIESELRLYEHPDGDPRAAVQRLARSWFGYDAYASRSWADSFFVTHPVYYQSYLVSHLFRAQVSAAMRRETDGPLWPNRRAGPWLTGAFLSNGARFDWNERLRDVTGAPLSAEPFVATVDAAR
ncbi:MAG: M3 family metallopeptidase [Thermoplasmata archaeon]|nr:M3 family metallopeptidase [Thermoplasmata archaeon]MCI4361828.1 M3 family metallopeptidase [Thermoplasmata archaeon]